MEAREPDSRRRRYGANGSMKPDDSGRPGAVTALTILVGLQGLSGLAGGIGLTVDPTGHSLGLPLTWLQGSPFSDYFVPGLVLLLALGMVPMIVAYGLWSGRPRARVGAVFVGGTLVVWLLVEIAVIGYRADPPLQIVYGVLAVLILVTTALPSVRNDVRSR